MCDLVSREQLLVRLRLKANYGEKTIPPCFKLTVPFLKFTRNLFDLLDSDEDGEIDITDFMSSLDRLEW